MTFDQIVQKVMDRTNQTSTEARTRIGDEVNEVYRDLVSSMGLETSIRSTTTGLSTADSRYVTFGGDGVDDDRVLKLLAMWVPADDDGQTTRTLQSVTFDEQRNAQVISTWPPTTYAIAETGATEVRVFLNAVGPADARELEADCLIASDEMEGDDQPFFVENFHDVLVYGTMAIELDKMEKDERASKAMEKFEKRSSHLRMFMSKDSYIRIHQGKNSGYGYYVPTLNN